DIGIGQEVLRQGMACSEAGRPEGVTYIDRIDLGGSGQRAVAACHQRFASGSDGRASRSRRARSPASNRRAPAAPIIAPLSVHNPGRGTINGILNVSASAPIRSRRQLFAATPPPRMIERAPTSFAARAVFVASTSTTESWNPHASSAVVASLNGVSVSSGAIPAAARASATILRAAVFSPEKLRSYESPIQARGNRTSRRTAPSAAFWIAGPPG